MWYLMVALVSLLGAVVSAPGEVSPRAIEMQRLNTVIRQFQSELNISNAQVLFSVVKTNERLASVRPSRRQSGTYLLELDEAFFATLSEEEQRAVIAHEMGHVWIFTHRPFKQSENLANQKARELVSEESLEKVYEKVWRLDGQHGTLDEFLTQKLSSDDDASQSLNAR